MIDFRTYRQGLHFAKVHVMFIERLYKGFSFS
jgi:hypothetical protein